MASIDVSKPASTDSIRSGDDVIRDLAAGVVQIVGVDHYMSTNPHGEADAAVGEHAKITLRELADDPTAVTDKGFVYTKNVSNATELFWEDAAGIVKQLTTGGKLNIMGDNGAVPVGSVIPFAGSSAPTGWLLCDGTVKSRTTYANLFAEISTTYGAGDGSTTFNLPDMRGRVPVGLDSGTFDSLGEALGAESTTLTATQLPEHTHGVYLQGDGTGTGLSVDAPNYIAGSGDELITQTLVNTTAGEAHSNLQPSRTLNFIIKY